MGFLQASLVALCAVISTVSAIHINIATTVKLDNGTFIGTTSNGITKFLGIPFAKPPIGDLRFRLPQEHGPYRDIVYNASVFGHRCPQQKSLSALPSGLPTETLEYLPSSNVTDTAPESEDCLTINVLVPADARPDANLPVVAWIHGGGFQLGSADMYDGSAIVSRSSELREPVVYVSMNYRLSALGFLAGKEVKDAGVGNLGLHDQRLALKWIQKYIFIFGGDPKKVTIWGESAGAVSVSLQMLANNGNPHGLFRAAFMQSGSPVETGDITQGQPYYDDLVSRTGCSGSSDTLSCLRTVPYATLKTAINRSPPLLGYQSLDLAWKPQVDGHFLAEEPQKLVLRGKIADIPFITSDCDDEGTLFALYSVNITTTDELHEYLAKYYFQNATSAEIDKLLTMYPQDIARGSPFGTGDQNAITPQFKRISAILGDLVFQAPRRFFLRHRSGKQKTWSYLSKRLKNLPVIGSVHGSDLRFTYGPGELMDYLIHFATNSDPNGGSSPRWPRYTPSSPQLMTFLPTPGTTKITQDTFRVHAINYLTKLSLSQY
ncbi:carotenoid ester lipase precursor [Lactifluus volemus]|nr:carotenoid ester lipase precursor [Lactifluus volemus]